jgi:hypothetical protein
VAVVNKALKEAVGKIVLDPEAGRLAIHWHRASEPTTCRFSQGTRASLKVR